MTWMKKFFLLKEGGDQNSKLLFVHQTPWQKRLLRVYGNYIGLLDATYKTTRYALPPVFPGRENKR